MSRIKDRWVSLRRHEKKGLVAFITAGDPSLLITRKLIQSLEDSGVDIIELGVPFSDPMADGPVIQRASERALKKKVGLSQILELVKDVRQFSQIPILLMGYYNPLFCYGLKKFARDASAAGVDGVLVVDLPPEESGDLDKALQQQDMDLIYLLSPTSDDTRIRKIAERGRGFIYFVSITGVTGGQLQSEKDIRKTIAKIRKHSKLPIAIGFGINSPETARQMSRLADGVVVGSSIVQRIEDHIDASDMPEKVGTFVAQLRKALA